MAAVVGISGKPESSVVSLRATVSMPLDRHDSKRLAGGQAARDRGSVECGAGERLDSLDSLFQNLLDSWTKTIDPWVIPCVVRPPTCANLDMGPRNGLSDA